MQVVETRCVEQSGLGRLHSGRPIIAAGYALQGRSGMKRREFITLLGGAAAWPPRGQQTSKLPTVGFLGPGTPATHSQWLTAFVRRMRELGWIEGHNLAIEHRWAEGRSERYAEIAAEFVRLKVDAEAPSLQQSRRHQPSRSCSGWGLTRSAPASSTAW
jgi:hypothetical protein